MVNTTSVIVIPSARWSFPGFEVLHRVEDEAEEKHSRSMRLPIARSAPRRVERGRVVRSHHEIRRSRPPRRRRARRGGRLPTRAERGALGSRGAADDARAEPAVPGHGPSTRARADAPLRAVRPGDGGLYIAAVDVSFPLSVGTSTSDVATEARSLGFRDAVVGRQKPATPPLASADYYVTGTYSGPPRTFPRSNAKGLVAIKDAWRIG